MTEPKRFGAADYLLLLLVLLVAAGLRAGWLWACADGGNNDGPLRMQDESPRSEVSSETPSTEMKDLVRNMREHQWFGSLAPFAHFRRKLTYPALCGQT